MRNIFQNTVWHSLRLAYLSIPLSPARKERLQQYVLARFDRIFRFILGGHSAGPGGGHKAPPVKYREREVRFVPHEIMDPLKDPPVKVLAFYLPQYHAIPENDAWWGNGFTEWSNVKPAQPLFEGHYQPYVPGELGYYNLLDVAVQERQAELARNYGIGGFCFHFYWFNGRRLLEKPIENYRLNKQPDLPFCLSWANENWTRRWDGREKDILISQHHSPGDDLAFIEYVATYMSDCRYIRIKGRPLLIVYRPGLLPSAAKTAERWRKWCLSNGIGEIYLAYVQSFDKMDPAAIGYDAAIEFPPNSQYPPLWHGEVRPLVPGFKAKIYDWTDIVKKSEQYTDPGYKLFRGVCPSWDNTPRRKNDSTVFINGHPDDFQRWVAGAARDTCSRFREPDERLVFVNAWNEWAEGAYLEPDEKYGYAHLRAIYDALREVQEQKEFI